MTEKINLEEELKGLSDIYGETVYIKAKSHLESFLTEVKDYKGFEIDHKNKDIIFKGNRSQKNYPGPRYTVKKRLSLYQDTRGYNISRFFKEEIHDTMRNESYSFLKNSYF